jgi:glycerate kinase
MDSLERIVKDEGLDDQVKDLAVNMERIQAIVTITMADVKDIVTTVEAFGAKALDLETKLANQQYERGKLITSSLRQTVTKLLIGAILAGVYTTDPVER